MIMIMTIITALDHSFSLDKTVETIPAISACIVELLQCEVQLEKSALEWLTVGMQPCVSALQGRFTMTIAVLAKTITIITMINGHYSNIVVNLQKGMRFNVYPK